MEFREQPSLDHRPTDTQKHAEGKPGTVESPPVQTQNRRHGQTGPKPHHDPPPDVIDVLAVIAHPEPGAHQQDDERVDRHHGFTVACFGSEEFLVDVTGKECARAIDGHAERRHRCGDQRDQNQATQSGRNRDHQRRRQDPFSVDSSFITDQTQFGLPFLAENAFHLIGRFAIAGLILGNAGDRDIPLVLRDHHIDGLGSQAVCLILPVGPESLLHFASHRRVCDRLLNEMLFDGNFRTPQHLLIGKFLLDHENPQHRKPHHHPPS